MDIKSIVLATTVFVASINVNATPVTIDFNVASNPYQGLPY